MKNITTTLRELNPEAANMWCFELNGELTPDTVSGKSDITAYFRCPENPKHLFSKKISKMTADDGHSYGCIFCGPNAKKVFPGETDFFTKCPEARSMWDYKLNLDIEPTKTFPNSNKHAYFRCEKGHSTYRKIMDFNHSPKCSECEKEKTKLVYNAPNTRLFWNINKNADVNLDDLTQSSRYNASFSCPNCKYEWPLQVSLWNERRYCPCCGFDGSEGSIEKNYSIIAQNPIITFRMANPEDSEMWRYDINGDMTPDNILFGSNKKAYFRCKNGHEFSNYIYLMTTSDGKPKGCPHCNSKKKIIYSGKNDFFSVCPVGKEMWDYNKNTNINPETLSPNSGVKANFKCSEGHEFPRRIQQFTKNSVCPECKIIKNSKTVVKPKITKTFRRINPEASKTWVNELNNGLTPDNVSEKSGKMVYLRCVNNPKHVYPKKICNIPKKEPFGCPYCKEEGKLAISSVINDEIAVCTENKKTKQVIADFPHMVNQWNYPKNKGIDISLTSANSKDSVWWRCKKCNHEWPAQIASRKMSKGLCPCCENRIVIKKGITDLFTMVPDLEKDYECGRIICIN